MNNKKLSCQHHRGQRPNIIPEDASCQPCHSGNYKDFRSCVSGTKDKDQIYIYFLLYHTANHVLKKIIVPIYCTKLLYILATSE